MKTAKNHSDKNSIALQWIRHQTVRAAAAPVVEKLETRTLMFAPSGMSAEGTSASSVTLRWTDNATAETHFIVDRSVDGVHYKRIGSVPANSTSFPDTGLQANTTYHYRVKAITTTLNSGWSRVTGSTLATSTSDLPAAPSGVAAESPAPDLLKVTWSDNADNETHFLLERSTNGVNFKRIASLGANTTEFLDSGLKADTKYDYRIRSVNGVGGSKYVRGSGTTVTDQPPAAPSGFVAAAQGLTQITLNWVDNASTETHFIIDRSPDGVTFSRLTSLAADSVSFVDGDLTAGTTYHYNIQAVNAAASSKWVRTSGTTDSAPEVPGLIDEDFSTGAGGFIPVDGAWDASEGVYGVDAPSTAGTTHLNTRTVHTTPLTGDFTLDVDATLINSTSGWGDFAVIFGYQDANNYYFFSSNQSNDGGTSGIFKVVDGTSTELADGATITSGVTYKVRVVRSGSSIYAYRNGTLVASANDATFSDGRVGLGTKSDWAEFDNFKVIGTAGTIDEEPVAIPAAPSGLIATAAGSSRIDLTWTDNSNDEVGFKIERSTDGGETWTQIATRTSNLTTAAATGLSATKTYHFRVRAYNSAGDSEYTNVSFATTAEAPVAGARPGPDNTGPSNPAILQASGSITVTKDGTVLENLFVTGKITIQANNVTIRNVKINATGQAYGIKTFSNFKNVLFEDGEVYGANGALVVGDGMTIRRLNLHHSGGDAVNPYGNFVMEYCWVHHLGMNEGSHADGVQMGGGRDFIFRYNFFDMPKGPGGNSLVEGGQTFRSNAAFFFSSASGNPTNVLIDNNWINGGNYTMYVWGSGHVITNNRFGRDYKYGVITSNSYGYAASGNVWDDTGAALNLGS